MNYIKLQYELGLGGAHSSEVKIPGLIAKETKNQEQELLDNGKNLFDEYMKGWRPNLQSKYEQVVNTINSVSNIGTTAEPLIPDLHHLLGQWETKQKYFDQNQVFGPPQPKYRRPQPSLTDGDYANFMAMLKKNNAKSEFENMIDFLFSLQEKKDYLLSVGYQQDSSGKFWKEKSTASNGELNSLFLHEITIKFKNMLLAKGTIKIKL